MNLVDRTIDEVNVYMDKYKPVLEYVKNKRELTIFSIVYEVGVNYLLAKHDILNADTKAWAMFVVNKLFNNPKVIHQISTDEDVHALIDDFLLYYQTNHEKFCEDKSSSSEFDRDVLFAEGYIKTKLNQG